MTNGEFESYLGLQQDSHRYANLGDVTCRKLISPLHSHPRDDFRAPLAATWGVPQIFLMWWLWLACFFGADPTQLVRRYGYACVE